MSRTSLLYVPVMLLCVVATLQRYKCHVDSLTKWKGGGFGMFSTPSGNRAVTVQFHSGSTSTRANWKDIARLPLGADTKLAVAEVKPMPSLATLTAASRELATHRWVLIPLEGSTETQNATLTSDGTLDSQATAVAPPTSMPARQTTTFLPMISPVVKESALAKSLAVDHIVVEVWEYRFGSDRNTLVLSQLASYEQPISPLPERETTHE